MLNNAPVDPPPRPLVGIVGLQEPCWENSITDVSEALLSLLAPEREIGGVEDIERSQTYGEMIVEGSKRRSTTLHAYVSLVQHIANVPQYLYEVVSWNTHFPMRKSRNSQFAQNYIPAGILKSNWRYKHQYVIPSILAVFVELEWSDPNWSAREATLARRLAILREQLKGRGTRIVLILIQKKSVYPSDIAVEDKLRRECGLDGRQSLFTMQVTDGSNVSGLRLSISKLEKAFQDIAYTYYRDEAKNVKRYRDALNKPLQIMLLVRHSYKIGSYAEFRHDYKAAVKNYIAAYDYMKEMKVNEVSARANEVKVVAGYLMIKINALQFVVGAPGDAVEYFRAHITYFKSLFDVNNKQLEFLHWSWVSDQYMHFGELLSAASALGLVTCDHAQQPGHYFRQAAMYFMKRRGTFTSVLGTQISMIPQVVHGDNMKPGDGIDFGLAKYRYVGQPPINFAKTMPLENGTQGYPNNMGVDHHIDPLSASNILPGQGVYSLEAVQALMAFEYNNVNYSESLIEICSVGMNVYKKMDSLRFTQYMALMIAQEYMKTSDFGTSLDVFEKVSKRYREEKWWSLLTSSLISSLHCAYGMKSVKDFVIYGIELFSGQMCLHVNAKADVQLAVCRLLYEKSGVNGEILPGRDSDIAISGTQSNCFGNDVVEFWEMGIVNSPDVKLEIEMTQLTPFIDCKVLFLENSVQANEKAHIAVFFRLMSPLPIRFSMLSLKFNSSKLDSSCCLEDGGFCENDFQQVTQPNRLSVHDCSDPKSCELLLYPGQITAYKFAVLPKENDDRNLECVEVALRLGTPKNHIILKWDVVDKVRRAIQMHSVKSMLYVNSRITNCLQKGESEGNGSCMDWENIPEHPLTRITPRAAEVDLIVEHTNVGFVNCFHELVVNVSSNESIIAEDVKIVCEVIERRDSLLPPERDVTVNALADNFENLGVSGFDGCEAQSFPFLTIAESVDDSVIDLIEKVADVHTEEFTNLQAYSKKRLEFSIPSVEPGKKIVKKVYVLSSVATRKCFNFKVVYTLPGNSLGDTGPDSNYKCCKEIPAVVDFTFPMQLSSCLKNLQFKTLRSSVNENEDGSRSAVVEKHQQFLLMLDLVAQQSTKARIEISSLRTFLNPDFAFASGEKMTSEDTSGETLMHPERLTMVYDVGVAKNAAVVDAERSIGAVKVSFKIGESEKRRCFARFRLPGVVVAGSALQVESQCPAFGRIGEILTLKYSVKNNSREIQNLEVVMEASEAFMLSGHKQTSARVLPEEAIDLTYNLYPLVAGNASLPKVHLYGGKASVDISWDTLPSNIYVKPPVRT
eukprot:Nk52_evm4s332 gene=Nk52_evmTU4s332